MKIKIKKQHNPSLVNGSTKKFWLNSSDRTINNPPTTKHTITRNTDVFTFQHFIDFNIYHQEELLPQIHN